MAGEPSVFVVTDAALVRLASGTIDLEGEFYAVLADDGATPTAENIDDLEDFSGGGAEAVTELLVEETTGYEDAEFTGVIIDEEGDVSFDSVTLEFDDGEASEIVAKWLVIVEGELGAGVRDPEHKVLGYLDLDDTGTEVTVTAEEGVFTVEPPTEGWFNIVHSNEP